MRALLTALAMVLPSVAFAEEFECLVEPWQVVELRPSVEGVIETVRVQRGDVIRKGQVLVELQSDAEKAAVDLAAYRARMEGQLAAAQTRVEYAQTKLSRLLDLEQKQFVAAQARDDAAAERRLAENELLIAIENQELAKLDLRRAQEQLALRTLASPFNGVVVDRMMNPGDLAESVSGRNPVLVIAETDPLKVDVVLPSRLYGQIELGQKADVMALVGGEHYAGVVKSVDRVIDAASNTFVARVELSNSELKIPVGSRCTAEFE